MPPFDVSGNDDVRYKRVTLNYWSIISDGNGCDKHAWYSRIVE